jgi:predicted unusual protein kinase regulating ubiquinone biosynthesis (AarF/ABC1/UbiB family)
MIMKKSRLSRNLALMALGAKTGTRHARQQIIDRWLPESRRETLAAEDARVLVEELSRLRGSVVKLGQILAVYGEHFLSPEIIEALHSLESEVSPMAWEQIHGLLEQEWKQEYFSELEIDHEPFAAASLSQIHLAQKADEGKTLCIKVQYPGVAESVDADLDTIFSLLKWSFFSSELYQEWVEEIRSLLKAELDYLAEAETTRRFSSHVSGLPEYRVPEVEGRYCTSRVMVSTYEAGVPVYHEAVLGLSQSRRNALGKLFLKLFFLELFSWGEMQTDPNPGNYLVDVGDDGEMDRIVMLDFGAVRPLSLSLRETMHKLLKAVCDSDDELVVEGVCELGFVAGDASSEVKQGFVKLCYAIMEPMLVNQGGVDPRYLNSNGEYRWAESRLMKRVASKAAGSATSRHFSVPGGEFLMLNRKLTGIFNFIVTLRAEFNGDEILDQFLNCD